MRDQDACQPQGCTSGPGTGWTGSCTLGRGTGHCARLTYDLHLVNAARELSARAQRVQAAVQRVEHLHDGHGGDLWGGARCMLVLTKQSYGAGTRAQVPCAVDPGGMQRRHAEAAAAVNATHTGQCWHQIHFRAPGPPCC